MNLFNIPTTFISHSIIIFCGSRGVKNKQSNVFSLVFEIAKKKKENKGHLWCYETHECQTIKNWKASQQSALANNWTTFGILMAWRLKIGNCIKQTRIWSMFQQIWVQQPCFPTKQS